MFYTHTHNSSSVLKESLEVRWTDEFVFDVAEYGHVPSPALCAHRHQFLHTHTGKLNAYLINKHRFVVCVWERERPEGRSRTSPETRPVWCPPTRAALFLTSSPTCGPPHPPAAPSDDNCSPPQPPPATQTCKTQGCAFGRSMHVLYRLITRCCLDLR